MSVEGWTQAVWAVYVGCYIDRKTLQLMSITDVQDTDIIGATERRSTSALAVL